MSAKNSKTVEFSGRSRASVDREAILVSGRDQMQARVDALQGQVREKESWKQKLYAAIAAGRGDWQIRAAGDTAIEIKALTETANGILEGVAEFNKRIEAERAIRPERAKICGQLADLAAARLGQDGQVQEKINALRAALRERGETTARMAELAEQVEFAGDLDSQRGDELAASLPAFLEESEIRTADLLGGPSDVLIRAVARQRVDTGVGESLRHVGIYEPGHPLLLTPQEFAQLSRTDIKHPKAGAFDGQPIYTLAPQRVCSQEQYESDLAEAEAEGVPVGRIWSRQDAERNGVAKQTWEAFTAEQEFKQRVEDIRSRTGRGLEFAIHTAERERRDGRRYV